MRGPIALLALELFCPLAASSQGGVPVPVSLVWKRVALPEIPYEREDINGLGFCGDTLYTNSSVVHALRNGGPGYPASAGTWEEVTRNGGGDDVRCAEVAGRSILFIERPSTIARSLDGGYTTEPVLVNGQIVPASTPEGALVGWFDSPGYIACRTEDGDAWACNPYVPSFEGFPRAFAAARPGGPIPATRLLASGQGGPAYSDDDGRSWHPSNLMTDAQTSGASLAVVDGGPLHGVAVAVVQGPAPDGQWEYRIVQSTDGAAWTDVGPAPVGPVLGIGAVKLLAVPGGLVAAYADGPPVWLSGDGGRTWRVVFGGGPEAFDDEAFGLALGPDGLLYVGVYSGTYWENERGGVYRTTAPVATVASEAPPDATPDRISMSIRPNPTGGHAEAVLALAEAAVVRVSVVDAAGREVAVVYDGPARAGATSVGLDTTSLPAGIYIVRVDTAGGHETARLVVAR